MKYRYTYMYIRNFQLAVGYTLNIAVSYFRSYWLLFARCTPVAYYTLYIALILQKFVILIPLNV